MNNFNAYSQYYDLLYADKPTAEECQHVQDTLAALEVAGTSWLEFGAGSGRHGQVFQACGITWSGIERSAEMAAIGREKGLDIHTGAIQEVSLLPRQFDAVLSLFHVVSYLTSNADVLQTFLNANRHLKPHGVFAFDVWYTPAVYHQMPEIREKEMSNASIRVKRKATPRIDWNANIVDVQYDISVESLDSGLISTFSENHTMRHFSLPEIQLVALQTGFEVIYTREWMTGNAPSPDTWGVFFILRKIHE